jgi:hypothetical protein
VILFLDFDGVLHPEVMGTPELCHLPALEELLREFPQVKLVLSTSWRIVYPHDALLEVFSADIRERIIGATPDHDCIPPDIREGLTEFKRQAEIEAWLLQNTDKGSFVVVDDCASEFTSGWAPLLLIDGRTGMTQKYLQRLRAILSSAYPTLSD